MLSRMASGAGAARRAAEAAPPLARGAAAAAGRKGEPPPAPDSTYDALKAAARRTGDAAREWMEGATADGHGAGAAAAAPASAAEAEAAVRRGAGAATSTAREWAQSKVPSPSAAAGGAAHPSTAGPGVARAAAESVEEGLLERAAGAARAALLGERPAAPPPSARAEWQDSRPAEQRAAEAATPRSRLTDEAFGDNPAEATQRKDKQTLPSDFYTRH